MDSAFMQIEPHIMWSQDASCTLRNFDFLLVWYVCTNRFIESVF